MVEIIVDKKKTRVAASSLASMYPYGIDETQKVITFDSGDKIITSAYYGEKVRQAADGMVDVTIDGRPVSIDAYGVNMIVPIDAVHFAVYTDSGDKYLVSAEDANRIAAAADKPLNNTTLYSIYECTDFGYSENKFLVGNNKMFEHVKEYGDAVIAVSRKDSGNIYRDYRLSTFQKEVFEDSSATAGYTQKYVARFTYNHGRRGLKYEDVITVTWDATDTNIVSSSYRGNNIIPVEDDLSARYAGSATLILEPKKELDGAIVIQTRDVDEKSTTGLYFVKGHYYRCEWGKTDEETPVDAWVWEDITADVQRKYLPVPLEKWENKIYEYTGETIIDDADHDNDRINGYFYQCVKDDDGVWKWLQKDVQPNRLYTYFDVDNRRFDCNNKRAFKYLCMGGDMVIVPTAYTHEYSLSTFQADSYTGLFSYECVIPGMYSVETFEISWTDPEISYVDLNEPKHLKSVLPVVGNLAYIAAIEENEGGLVIQESDYSDNIDTDYIKGHYYRCESYLGNFVWKDITGTIQVEKLPAAIENNEGKIYEYVGEDMDATSYMPELVNGYFYQCKEKVDEPGVYEWVQKDVQPNGRLYGNFFVGEKAFKEKNININEKIFKHMVKGGDVVLHPDTDEHEYVLSTFQNSTYVGIFEYEDIVPGKYRMDSYILTWSPADEGKVIDDVVFTSNVIPVFGDLTELSYEPVSQNEGGVVIQSRKYEDGEENTYILGHAYRCESYLGGFIWNDITGTVQVDKLPPAVEENYGKIFEYTGETIDTVSQPKYRINGFFYQCVEDATKATGFDWVQKDVQPNSISIIFDLDSLRITNYGNKRLFERIFSGGDATMQVIGAECSDTKEYRMSTFYNSSYAALFTNEEIFPGKHKFSSYILDWDDADQNIIESYRYASHVIPILGNAYLIEPNEDNENGVVLQSIDIEDPVTEEKLFELGHLYKSTWDDKEGRYEWSDMTSTIQVAVLPKASEDYVGVIYEYTGADKPASASLPELINGYFYQCVRDDNDPTVYRWIQKDVQPTRICTVFHPVTKSFEYSNKKMFKYLKRGGLAAIKTDGEDNNPIAYYDVKSFEASYLELVISNDYIVPGKYSINEYTIDWDGSDTSYSTIADVVFDSYVIPYYANLVDSALEPCEANEGGIIIQSSDIDGIINTSYIKGHYYESISYDGGYIWDDITGTIQTKNLPLAEESNKNRIYEYIGENAPADATHDELVNGFFYQCRKNDSGDWYWFQKDVQPNRVKTVFDTVSKTLEYGNKRVYDAISGGADAIIIPDEKEYALVTLNAYVGFFEREFLTRGKHEVVSYTLTWNDADTSVIDDVDYAYAVIPVCDDLADAEVKLDATTLGGVVMQMVDYSGSDVSYIKGHIYENQFDGADYKWVDITGSIQVSYLPEAKEDNENKIYEYVGIDADADASHDKLVNGFFYQCRMNDAGDWYWFQKDVQPSRLITKLDTLSKSLEYGNKRTYNHIANGGDAVIIPDEKEYALVTLNAYVGFFKNEFLTRGKHEITSYTITWDDSNVAVIDNIDYAYAIIPVCDDLADTDVKLDASTLGGVVMQMVDYGDVNTAYIKGHIYENQFDGIDFKWVDITGSIQVSYLPEAKEDNDGKIYEYVGADAAADLTHDKLINGFFYQCSMNDAGDWFWFQKDVQPARIKTELDVDAKTLEYGNKRTYNYIANGGDVVLVSNDSEFALVSLNAYAGFFEKEYLVRGKHELTSYTLTWDSSDVAVIDNINYAYAVIPVCDDLSDADVKLDETTYGGVVMQMVDYSDVNVDYIKGHLYENQFDGVDFKWVDITGTIQVSYLPSAKFENENRIYEYVGVNADADLTHDKLINGFFYQCRMNDAGDWYWFQKDVQPARIKTELDVDAKTLEYGNKRTYNYIANGGDAVIIPDENEYALVTLNAYVGFFEREYLTRGKHAVVSYTLTWNYSDVSIIEDIDYAYAVIPVCDDLTDAEVKLDASTLGGVVMQMVDYGDANTAYIKGHIYENQFDGADYKWVDITGSIQVSYLPDAKSDNDGKIYEYVGVDTAADASHDKLINGFFYQCRMNDAGDWFWFQKDVQPARIKTELDVDAKALDYGNKRTYNYITNGGDAVIVSNDNEYALVTLNAYEGFFEKEYLVRGKHEISSYTITWDSSDVAVIDDINYAYAIIPVCDDLADEEVKLDATTYGGVVMQMVDYADANISYIKGHIYENQFDGADYKWVDITGSIQVSYLPAAKSDNADKIYEYVGADADADTTHDKLVNGFFYQCRKDDNGDWFWFQKDVQPSRIKTELDVTFKLLDYGNKRTFNYMSNGGDVVIVADDVNYSLTTLNAYTGLFKNEFLTRGKHEITSYSLTWDDVNPAIISYVEYAYAIIPVYDDLSDSEVKLDATTYGGVVIQTMDYSDADVDYIKGHMYENQFDGADYKWVDITGTIQVSYLPTAKAENEGKIYEYIGENKDAAGDMPELINGYFYQCVEDTETAGKFVWKQKDVQPNGRLQGNFFFYDRQFREKTTVVNQKIYKHMVKGGDVVMTIDTDDHEFTLSSFQTASYLAIFEYENIVPGKYAIDSYLLEWNSTDDGKTIDDVRHISNVIPVFGDLTDMTYAPCAENEGGVVAQYRKYDEGEENTYILGHYYRCESYLGGFMWNDITGTIQVDQLPPASEENLGKIFEYVGENVDTPAQPKYRINGYFYQCVVDASEVSGFNWVQKDVQPNSISIIFDLDSLRITNYGNKRLFERIYGGGDATMQVIGAECSDTKEYRMSTFYNTAYAALFTNEEIYPGKHKFSSYILDWDDADQNIIESYRYASHVIPILGNAYLIEANEDNADGVILQSMDIEDPVTEEKLFELGHLYKSTWNDKESSYEWSDMTSTIQVAVLPKASEDYVGVIYEYVGPDKEATASMPELVNGYFYQCVQDDVDPTVFRWMQKDVQPTRVCTVFRPALKTFDYSNKKMFKYLRRGGIAAIETDGSDNNPIAYYDVKSFDSISYELVLTNDYLIRGRHSTDKYIVDWNTSDISVIDTVEFESYVIPYYDDLTDIMMEPTEDNLGGVVIQSKKITDNSYILGHHYVCESYLGGYRWSDITGTIQIDVLPAADENSYLKIYEYTGEHKDEDKVTYMPELINGFFYQCVEDDRTVSGYNWKQKDVQPNGRLHTKFFCNGGVTPELELGNDKVAKELLKGADAVIVPDTDNKEYTLGLFNADTYTGRFDNSSIIPGKYEIDSYTLTWIKSGDKFDDVNYECSYAIIPVFGDLTDMENAPCAANYAGVVIQSEEDIYTTYLLGHTYRCESYLGNYVWRDITGTIQVEVLPDANASNNLKIYEYVGEHMDAMGNVPELINGFFYQCVEDETNPGNFIWRQKDVQPNGRLHSTLFIKDTLVPALELGNAKVLEQLIGGADAVIVPDTDKENYYLAHFSNEGTAYAGRFDKSTIIPGKYEIDSYTITWEWASKDYISYESSYTIIPVFGDLTDMENAPCEANYAGVIIQSEEIADNAYILGHTYRCESYLGGFIWNDITGTVQVSVLPDACESNNLKIYEYVGEHKDAMGDMPELINGFFYQCVEDDNLAGHFIWKQKDVQPNGRLHSALFIKDTVAPELELGNAKVLEQLIDGADAVIVPDTDNENYYLGQFFNEGTAYEGRFDRSVIIPGKYEIDSYTLTWEWSTKDSISYESSYTIIPVFADLTDIENSPCEENYAGIVIQSEEDVYNTYLLGHTYRCESYLGNYVWRDITGTIQVKELPYACESNYLKIYEYVGEHKDAAGDMPELINGYFYQCSQNETLTGYIWKQKDVQPNGRLYSKFYCKDGVIPTLEVGNEVMLNRLRDNADAVISPDTDNKDYVLGQFTNVNSTYVGRFDNCDILAGKYEIDSYTLTWTTKDTISYENSYVVLPVLGNLMDSELAASAQNYGGMVIQSESVVDNAYIKGHYYRSELDENGDYVWNDITGTIQVEVLPTATADNAGVIYEYIGEDKDWMMRTPRLTNGRFYESVYDSALGEYTWREKLTSTNRMNLWLNTDNLFTTYELCPILNDGSMACQRAINEEVYNHLAYSGDAQVYFDVYDAPVGETGDTIMTCPGFYALAYTDMVVSHTARFTHNSPYVERGKQVIASFDIVWNSADHTLLDAVKYTEVVIPYMDDASEITPGWDNYGGVVIQNVTPATNKNFILGHTYKCVAVASATFGWVDITGTIQVEVLPDAIESNENAIYEYIGEYKAKTSEHDTLINGFFYQCRENASGDWYWFQKDVQPNGVKTDLDVAGKSLEYGNKRTYDYIFNGGTVTVIPDTDDREFVLDNVNGYIGRFSNETRIPGKYEIESYTITWDNTDTNNIDIEYAYNILPVYGKVENIIASEDNLLGVIIEDASYYNAYTNYIKGHAYRCESYLGGFVWNDITGTIQVSELPLANEELEGVIYQYTGEDAEPTAMFPELVNGYFYQCIEDPDNLGNYIWKQKDVQPGSNARLVLNYSWDDQCFLDEDNNNYNAEVYRQLTEGHDACTYINLYGRRRKDMFNLATFSTTMNFGEFRLVLDVPGDSTLIAYVMAWDSDDKSIISQTFCTHTIVPQFADLMNDDFAANEMNAGGTVFQNTTYIGKDAEYLAGHQYTSASYTYKEGGVTKTGFRWNDITGTIQVDKLPYPTSRSYDKIYEYVGENQMESTYFPALTNGFFYQCVVDENDPTSYMWVQKDVQPQGARMVKNFYTANRQFKEDGVNINGDIFGELAAGADLIMVPDSYTHEYTLSTFQTDSYVGLFEYVTNIPGKYQIESYTLNWNALDSAIIDSAYHSSDILPVLGDLSLTEYEATEDNMNGVIIQTKDYLDDSTYTNYIRGHYYRSESYTFAGVTTYRWNDITGTIQVEELPAPCASLEGKIYEYIGEDNEDKRLTNGFFYQCVKDEIFTDMYIWKAKDVQERFDIYSEFDCTSYTFAFGNKEMYDHIIRCGEATVEFLNTSLSNITAKGNYKSYRVELTENNDVISFKGDIIIDGYHKVDIIEIGWSKTDKNVIDYIANSEQSHVIPVSGSVIPNIGIKACAANEGGLVIQNVSWSDGTDEVIVGHLYKCYNVGTTVFPAFMWVDITDHMQVTALPVPMYIYEDFIYQYIGEYAAEDKTFPERITGYFYKCEKYSTAGTIDKYRWVQQDVQPRKVTSNYRTGDKLFDYGNAKMFNALKNNSYLGKNFDFVITTDGVDANPIADYELAYFDIDTRYARFERTVSVPGKYATDEYDIVWSDSSESTISSSSFVHHCIPVDGNVNVITASEENEGGLIIQNIDVYDETVTTKLKLIRGHIYRCDEKLPYTTPIEYEWVDITGSIQVSELPAPAEDLVGKIYEYIGETGTSPYEYGVTIVNGFFYQCNEVLAQYGWVEDTSGATGPDVVVLPEASEDEEGNIYRYTGTTTTEFKHNSYYRCVKISDKTYVWRQKNVQPVDAAKQVGFTITGYSEEHHLMGYGNFDCGNDVLYEHLMANGSAVLTVSIYEMSLVRFSKTDAVADWAMRSVKPGTEEYVALQTKWDVSHTSNPVTWIFVEQGLLVNAGTSGVRDIEIYSYSDIPELDNTNALVFQPINDFYKESVEDPYYFAGHFYRVSYNDDINEYYWQDCGATHQVEEMPEPGWRYKNLIYQYTGDSTDEFTSNYFYKCLENRTSYIWERDMTATVYSYVTDMPKATEENYGCSYYYDGLSYCGNGFVNGEIYTCVDTNYKWVAISVQPDSPKTILRLIPQVDETTYLTTGYQFKADGLTYLASNQLVKDAMLQELNDLMLFNEDDNFIYQFERTEKVSSTLSYIVFNSDYRLLKVNSAFDVSTTTGFPIYYGELYSHKIDGGTWD